MGKYKELAEKIGSVVDEKNAEYGSAFDHAGEFLKLIYPNGIPVNAYVDALCAVRLFDKLKRIGAVEESVVTKGKIDAWKDIVGYGLLSLYKDTEHLSKEISETDSLLKEDKKEEK